MRRVLWTLVPIGSLGLLGWVPPLRIAIRRKTPAAWLWFAGSAGAAVLIIVLVSTVRTSAIDDTPPGWVGWIELLNIIFTAIYTGIATKALTPKPRPMPFSPQAQDGYGNGYGYGYGYNSGYGPQAGRPEDYRPTMPVAVPPVMPQQPVMPQPVVAPSAAQAAAAEVQAELRELRDLLGESGAGRTGGEQDRRGRS